jgi:hypothetical protein
VSTQVKKPAVALFLLAVVCAAPAAAQTTERAPQDEGRGARPARERREARVSAWQGPMSQLVWIDAQTGIESVELQTFIADFDTVSAGFLPTSGVGPTATLGAGLRFGFVTLGARGRVASFEDGGTVGSWQIWTLDGELGIRVPLYRLEPHVVLAAGYSSFGGLGTAIRGLQQGLDVHGIDMRIGGGVDYWITHHVSLGLDVNGGLLAVARPGVSVRDLATAKQIGTLNDAKARVLEASGASVGTTLALTGALGVHF